MTTSTCSLAIDGGGTFLKAALFSGMKLIPDTFISIPACSDGTLKEISGTFTELGRLAAERAASLGRTICAVGVGIPDPFDFPTGTSQMDHKFASAKGYSFAPWILQKIGDVPIRFGHDAAVFFQGCVHLEQMFHHADLCGVTLGTGLGFAAMKDHKMLLTQNGDPLISLWNRPYQDSIAEEYVSRRAVLRTFEQSSGRSDLDVYEISQLARQGDPSAISAFTALGYHLGTVLKPVMEENGFTAVLLGGAISKSADLLLEALTERLSALPYPVEIRPVKDIDNAPLYGAASLCLEA